MKPHKHKRKECTCVVIAELGVHAAAETTAAAVNNQTHFYKNFDQLLP